MEEAEGALPHHDEKGDEAEEPERPDRGLGDLLEAPEEVSLERDPIQIAEPRDEGLLHAGLHIDGHEGERTASIVNAG